MGICKKITENGDTADNRAVVQGGETSTVRLCTHKSFGCLLFIINS